MLKRLLLRCPQRPLLLWFPLIPLLLLLLPVWGHRPLHQSVVRLKEVLRMLLLRTLLQWVLVEVEVVVGVEEGRRRRRRRARRRVQMRPRN